MWGFMVLSTLVKQVYVGFQGVIYMDKTGVCVASGCYLPLSKQVYVRFQGVIYMGKTCVCGVSGCYLHG